MDFIWSFLLCLSSLDVIFALPAGKNITLTQLFSIELADLPDVENNIKRQYTGIGIDAQQDSASLSSNATMFRLHRPGFQHVARSVALESNLHPGLFLRYKNYKFRLEKAKPTGLFEKDSTFLERNPFGPTTISLELFSHPGWFVCHDTSKPFMLMAESKVFRGKEFDQKCVYRQKIRKYSSQIAAEQKFSDKEQEELKAAQILESLVSQESVGEILAVKNKKQNQKKMDNSGVKILTVGNPETVSRPSTALPNTLTNKARVSGQIRQSVATPQKVALPIMPSNVVTQYTPYKTRARNPSILRSTYRSNPRLNTYTNAVNRIRYFNNLRHKGAPAKTLPRMQYTGYVSGINNQNSRYRTTYTAQRRPLYRYANKVNYATNYGRGQVGVGTGLQFKPGQMKPSKIITMSRQSQPVYKYPVNNIRQLAKAPSFNFVAVDNPQATIQKAQPITSKRISHVTSVTSSSRKAQPITSGSGSGEGPASSSSTSKEPKTIDPKTAVYGLGDKCISIRFYNKIRKPVKIVSSMKRAGYLVTAETFKLKTIFKHARKDRKVHFYAQDLNDKEDVLLNNNNVVTVIPGPCDLPYRSIYLSRNSQYTNDEIENFLKTEEQNISLEKMKTSTNSHSTQNGFSQWSEFGPCSASCGTGFQTRNRRCLSNRACLGTTKESRACILTPCAEPNCIQTYGGNVPNGKCCSLPFIFEDTVYDKCITHARTGGLWCSTTPNYDTDKSWGFCKMTARRSNMFYRPPGYISARTPRISYRALVPSFCPKSCYNMCIPGCHATCCSAHALAFPSVSKKKTNVKKLKRHPR